MSPGFQRSEGTAVTSCSAASDFTQWPVRRAALEAGSAFSRRRPCTFRADGAPRGLCFRGERPTPQAATWERLPAAVQRAGPSRKRQEVRSRLRSHVPVRVLASGGAGWGDNLFSLDSPGVAPTCGCPSSDIMKAHIQVLSGWTRPWAWALAGRSQ